MTPILLQLTGDSVRKITDSLAHAQATAAPAQTMNVIDLLIKGGWMMVPLGLLSLIAVFVFFERYFYIRKVSKSDDNFMNIIRDHIINGNVQAARSLAKNTANPVARVIDKGIQRIGKPIDAIENSMENIGNLEIYKMEQNLGILSVIARIAPMFGFLGTIVGMIQLFYEITSTGVYDLTTIAGGIYVKMITSASGLIIGLLAFVGYSFLHTQIDKCANKMERASSDFIDILQEPTR
ncbi:MotA/TolQ/ExbB proton channel family protein [Dinghuibacter silviterrae]|uniref:Outer membrane transport energization protein ExbB n=1 Tax=Dinghuibacter silviterrae TaxID=1539049 RepID=A0A4R8DEA6_9BACT|nr:MotA/TolQ/ExbB proton channel family protein [Dinghuibacter silviterrae]TDW95755.1 outer membrane transport energization protein ExbB [Dinghuibacter silviterrae]